MHNVDVLSTIDFNQMLNFHKERNALATLAVQDRSTSRYLLFDENGRLCGRRAGLTGEPEMVRQASAMQALAFCGIHIVSPRIFPIMLEEGAFSVIPLYLRLAEQGEAVQAYRADQYYWRDLGRPEHIERAAGEISTGAYRG